MTGGENKMTKKEVNKKYKGKYIEIYIQWDYKNDCWDYEVGKIYKKIHENTTLGEDVGTSLEYRR